MESYSRSLISVWSAIKVITDKQRKNVKLLAVFTVLPHSYIRYVE